MTHSRCCRYVSFLILTFALASGKSAEEPARVQKIWDKAPHSAFTDLVRFKDRWFCSFREGDGHAAGPGTIRVLTSVNGEKWESAASIEKKDVDLRDPKLSVTPDGRLMMVGGAAEPASRNPLKDHYSFVSFSKDGKDWSKLERVCHSWEWLWRVAWHKGTAYGVAYRWDQKTPDDQKKWEAALYKSPDGLKWEMAADFKVPNATEASLAFDGDTMYCLLRRDGKPNSAQLGNSKPPYSEWTWKDLGVYYGGPMLLQIPDGSWYAAGRMIEKGLAKTVVCKLDVKEGKLTPMATLPSGGDTSYPGMIWHHGEIWISYYSSHEGKTGIYLARVQTKK